MWNLTRILLAGVLAYLVGNYSFATRLSLDRGVNIRSVGSGNPGGNNVMRALGPGVGVAVIVLDALKGALACWLGCLICYASDNPAMHRIGMRVAAIGVVIGHNWPVFHGFKGGKGIATTLGIMISLSPWAALVGVVLHQLVMWTTKYMSLAGLVAATGVTIFVNILSVQLFFGPWVSVIRWTVIAVWVVWAACVYAHRGNIKRLLNGMEPKLKLKR